MYAFVAEEEIILLSPKSNGRYGIVRRTMIERYNVIHSENSRQLGIPLHACYLLRTNNEKLTRWQARGSADSNCLVKMRDALIGE